MLNSDFFNDAFILLNNFQIKGNAGHLRLFIGNNRVETNNKAKIETNVLFGFVNINDYDVWSYAHEDQLFSFVRILKEWRLFKCVDESLFKNAKEATFYINDDNSISMYLDNSDLEFRCTPYYGVRVFPFKGSYTR